MCTALRPLGCLTIGLRRTRRNAPLTRNVRFVDRRRRLHMDGPRVSRVSRRMSKVTGRVVVERSDPTAVSRELWKGLVKFNREQAGPLRYRRTVLSGPGGKGRLFGGAVLLSFLRESYIEMLWHSGRAGEGG